jgi:2-polyprenyl-6-methoxyphenol hydroxylase-like FAD-dependent oxidoreductase
MRAYDVVICGAGVGGLALAIGLGRLGRSVLVVERHPADSSVHKGEFLQPRSLEILAAWQVLSQVFADGAAPIDGAETRGADGEFLGELDYRQLPGPFNHGLVQEYVLLKNSLERCAGRLAEIERGVHVTGLITGHGGRVRGVRVRTGAIAEEIGATLTVGADGRMSLVRRQAGLDPRFAEYGHQMMSLDLPGASLAPRVIAYLTRDGLRALYPMPKGSARLYVQIPAGTFGTLRRGSAARWQDELLAGAPALAAVHDNFPADLGSAQVQRAWRYCVRSWGRCGVALLGDAAHGVHPSAGQGMNTAVMDAYVLSEVLSGAQSEREVDEAVAEYQRRRVPQFAQVARICSLMATFCTSTSPLVRRLATHMGRRNRTNQRLQQMIAYNVSGMGQQRFTVLDRMYQLGLLRDPRPMQPITLACRTPDSETPGYRAEGNR